MANMVKTLPSGKTFRVDICFQDSDRVPNLHVAYSAEDISGREIKATDWDREIVAEHGVVLNALKRAGFRLCQSETVVMDGPGGIRSSEGMEHPRHRTADALERAGESALAGVGYETPPHSVVIPPPGQPKKGFADRVPEPQKKQVDLKKMRQEIEDRITGAMGNTAPAMRLTSEVMDIVKAHMRGAGMSPPE